MSVHHDMQCDNCGSVVYDLPLSIEGTKCTCGGTMEIFWNAPRRNAIAFDLKDAVVVYEHPETGKIVWPGRNDRPMPERYRLQGYARKEMRSLHEVDQFSKKHNVVNEAAHYDRGSGRSYDTEPGRQ